MSHPSGSTARRASGWRTGSGTVAASGTVAPSWLWDLERHTTQRKISQLFTKRHNAPVHFFLRSMAAGEIGNHPKTSLRSCLQIGNPNQLTIDLCHRGQSRAVYLILLSPVFFIIPKKTTTCNLGVFSTDEAISLTPQF